MYIMFYMTVHLGYVGEVFVKANFVKCCGKLCVIKPLYENAVLFIFVERYKLSILKRLTGDCGKCITLFSHIIWKENINFYDYFWKTLATAALTATSRVYIVSSLCGLTFNLITISN